MLMFDFRLQICHRNSDMTSVSSAACQSEYSSTFVLFLVASNNDHDLDIYRVQMCAFSLTLGLMKQTDICQPDIYIFKH